MRSLLWLRVAGLGVDHLNGGEANPSSSIEIRDLIINEQSGVQVQRSEGMVEYIGVGFGATDLKGEHDFIDGITETEPVDHGFSSAGAVANDGSLYPDCPERLDSRQGITEEHSVRLEKCVL